MASTPPAEPRPAGVRTSRRYFAELEALRGIAIALVIGFHFHGGLMRWSRDTALPGPALVREGQAGVDLFFVLSGFLLALPFLAEAAGGQRVSRRQYYLRRALRILPLYYAAVVVAVLFHADRLRDLAAAVPYLLFLNSFGDVGANLMPFYGVWWSLATEVQFYLLLPLLPAALASRRLQRSAPVLLAAYVGLYALFLANGLGLDWDGRLALARSVFGRAPLFAAGIIVASIYLRAGDRIRARLGSIRWFSAGGADAFLVALFVVLELFLGRVATLRPLRAELPPWCIWHVALAPLFGGLLFLLLLAPLRLKPLLCNPLLTGLGVLSYSLYLVHTPVAWPALAGLAARHPALLASRASMLAVAIGLGATCVALSFLTYRLIERPFLVRKARLDR